MERCPEHDLAPVVDRTGQRVADRYVIDHLIGLGNGETTVWQAEDTVRRHDVALKLCPAEVPDELERTRHGVGISAGFDHPNITRVFEYGFTRDGALYCAMERLRGRTLQRLLEHRPLALLDAIAVADQLLAALEHIHEERVLHRDIKPANLFVHHTGEADGRGWTVKLLDFGVACDKGTASRGEPGGRIVGTPEYMAPEQVTAGPLDERTDLYQFGVVLYRMLTGRLPFLLTDRREIYQAHLEAPVPRMREVAPERDLPLGVERVMRRLLAKRPERRFSSAAAVRLALSQVAEEPAAIRARRPVTQRLALPVDQLPAEVSRR